MQVSLRRGPRTVPAAGWARCAAGQGPAAHVAPGSAGPQPAGAANLLRTGLPETCEGDALRAGAAGAE